MKPMHRKRTLLPPKPPRKPIERRVEERYWWEDEYVKYLEWEHRYKLWFSYQADMVRFALATGMRVSEMAACKVEDCDPVGKVKVPRSKSGPHITLIEPRHMAWYREFLSRKSGPLLFEDRNLRTLQRWWDQVCQEAGVRNLGGIHGTRHTYATWAIASGWLELHELSRCLGHSSYAITADFYVGAELERKLLDGRPPRWWGPAQGIFEQQQTNVVAFRRAI